jgi:anaerobic selenocysteine-containing dehydrogenase
MTELHTRTCHICEANCGILVELEGERVRSIRGDPDDVLSRGHICPKATAIADIEADPDRLRRPARRTGQGWVEADWDEAFADIAARYAAIKAEGGEGALYIGNPTAHHFAVGMQFGALKKALATNNVFSASTVDQIPHQLVQMWMYGHNALFPIADIDRTTTMLIVGGNPIASNGSVWTVPDVKARIAALKARGGRLVVVDPRRTETAEVASAHHFIRPGTDPAFLLALLLALDEAGLVRPGRLAPLLDAGWESGWGAFRRFDPETLARWCGIDVGIIRALARELGGGAPAIVYGRMGVSVTQFGALNHWLIQCLNIATGNLDREGGLVFSVPPADIVAASGPGSFGRHRSRVKGLAEVMGEYPVITLADEIETAGPGQVRALVTVAGNPVLSTPDGSRLARALATLELMVSIDMYVTATSAHAHWILPPCGPLAKSHYPLLLGPIAVRNFAKYSPPLRPPGAGEKDDWEIVSGLARAIGAARGLELPAPVHPEAALDRWLRAGQYHLSLDALKAAPHGVDLGPHEAGRLPGRLRTPDGRIHAAPPACLADLDRLAARMAEPPAGGLLLIGRRHIRTNNSWLANSKRLVKGPERCTLMIHPEDARERGIGNGDQVTITSRVGAVTAPAEVTGDIMPGVVSLPHGWGHGRPGVRLRVALERPGVSLNDLTDPERHDPVSGNAALTATPVEVALAAASAAA